jgi:hypothetical protein
MNDDEYLEFQNDPYCPPDDEYGYKDLAMFVRNTIYTALNEPI